MENILRKRQMESLIVSRKKVWSFAYAYDIAKKAVDLKEMLDIKEFLEFFGEKRINS